MFSYTCRCACSIELTHEVIVTGGLSTQNMVTVYNSKGTLKTPAIASHKSCVEFFLEQRKYKVL